MASHAEDGAKCLHRCCLHLRFPASPMFDVFVFDVLKKAVLPTCLTPALCAPDLHWAGTFCHYWITCSHAWHSWRIGVGFGQVHFRPRKDFLLDPVRYLNVCFSRPLQDQPKVIALLFIYPKVPDSGFFQERSFFTLCMYWVVFWRKQLGENLYSPSRRDRTLGRSSLDGNAGLFLLTEVYLCFDSVSSGERKTVHFQETRRNFLAILLMLEITEKLLLWWRCL